MKKQLPSGISSGGSFFRPSFELVRENAIFAKNTWFMTNDGITIQMIRETASKILPVDARVVLFGSRARNTAREDSDWDLLIILNKDRRSVSDIE